MMHTIISLSDVFWQNDAVQPISEPFGNGAAEYIRYNGEKRLQRLFSTDPTDYLKILK